MSNVTRATHENTNYVVIVTDTEEQSLFEAGAKIKIKARKCYGVKNKKTEVTESFFLSLPEALIWAEINNAILENEWWKQSASQEISAIESKIKRTLH